MKLTSDNINFQPSFCAKIKINKTGFKNFGSDVVDSGVMSFDSGASASINMSAFSSPSVLKDPKIGNDGFVPGVKGLADDFEQRGLAISARNISPSVIDEFKVKDVNTLSANSADYVNNMAVSTVGLGLGVVNSGLKSAKNNDFIYRIKSGLEKLILNIKTYAKKDNFQKDFRYKEQAQLSTGSGLISTGLGSYASSAGVGLENTAFHSDIINSVSSPLKDFDMIKLIHKAHRPDTNPYIGYSGRSLFASSGASIGLGSQIEGLKVLNKTNTMGKHIPS